LFRFTNHAFGVLLLLASVLWGKSFADVQSRRNLLHPVVQVRGGGIGILKRVDGFWRSSPYAAGGIVCGIKACAADLIVQKNTKMTNGLGTAPTKSTTVDLRRNLAFIFYGSMYQGVCQEYIYNHLYPLWFGRGSNWEVVLIKVAFDCLVQTTLVTLPVAYLAKAVIYRYSFREAMQRYVADIRKQGLLKKYFSLWAPVNCLTFSVVPEHYRVTWIACVSFFWLMVLSAISSKADLEAANGLQKETKILVNNSTRPITLKK